MSTVYILLALIFSVVLFVPFLFKAVEDRLEVFLLIAGIASVSATHSWSFELLGHATKNPLEITAAVLVASLAFKFISPVMDRGVRNFSSRFGARPLAFMLVAGLGLISGLVTALVAALALSEAVRLLRLDSKSELRLVVLACYSIGLGAVLTPLGEPLAAISVARLAGSSHHPDFWFLFRLLGLWVLPLILVLALGSYFAVSQKAGLGFARKKESDSLPGLLLRTLKVYVFVVGLELLGAGFNPVTGDFLKSLSPSGLYWASLVSGVLDNASLAAAGLSPEMSVQQLRFFLLGLMISGGMMVPGNFPNIICAAKLGIGFKKWAAFGVPVGFALMAAVYLLLLIFPGR